MALNIFSRKQPIQVYDTSKSVQQNMAGQGTPSAEEIAAAYRTPQAQLALSQPANAGSTTPAGNTAGTVANTQRVQQPITSTEELAKAMGYTSPEEEERLRKASIANQRIMAVADALRHIGNIYHTTKGAPAQQFNSPVMEERNRYLQGKALRDNANAKYLTYQQQRAAQEEKARQWEETFKYNALRDAAKLKAQQDYQAATLKERARVADQNLEFNKSKQKATEERWKRMDDESVRSHKANEALRRQSNGIAAGSLNLRKQQFEYKKQHGGGSGSGNGGGTLTFRGANGFYSKKMNAQELNSMYNQLYDVLAEEKIINKNTGIFGDSKMSQQAKREAVDNAIYRNPRAGEILQRVYEFGFDPRGTQQPTKSQKPNVNFAPWNGGTLPGAFASSTFTPNADDEDDEDLFDDEDFSDFSF